MTDLSISVATRPSELLVWSADTTVALSAARHAVLAELEASP